MTGGSRYTQAAPGIRLWSTDAGSENMTNGDDYAVSRAILVSVK